MRIQVWAPQVTQLQTLALQLNVVAWPWQLLIGQAETVKFAALVAVPPRVVITIFPVTAPVGTIAVTWLSEFTVKVAFTPPKVTFDVCFRLTPVMVTEAPTLFRYLRTPGTTIY
jgi:hypothetical protein